MDLDFDKTSKINFTVSDIKSKLAPAFLGNDLCLFLSKWRVNRQIIFLGDLFEDLMINQRHNEEQTILDQ